MTDENRSSSADRLKQYEEADALYEMLEDLYYKYEGLYKDTAYGDTLEVEPFVLRRIFSPATATSVMTTEYRVELSHKPARGLKDRTTIVFRMSKHWRFGAGGKRTQADWHLFTFRKGRWFREIDSLASRIEAIIEAQREEPFSDIDDDDLWG